MSLDPLHQFVIQPLIPIEVFGYDISFTNSSLFMVVGTVLIISYHLLMPSAIIPGRFQGMVETSYEFIAHMVEEGVGSEGKAYFPFVLSLFMFVLVGNLLGMLPYGFTFTSHIVVTFALAMVVFLTVTIVGLVKHRLKFFRLFFPEGTPIAVAPILIPIEIMAYLVRPITLSVRLFANMLAGHVILKIFAGFTVALGIFGVAPIALNICFTGFEFFVAMIQAYVFTILTCLYIHDAVHLH